MKIAHIVSTFPPYYGGMGNTAFAMAAALAERGHEVTVFTPEYVDKTELREADEEVGPVHAPELAEKIVAVKRLTPSLSYGNAARLPQLARELDAFDIVHLHYPFFGTANLVRRWKKKHPDRPLVLTYHMDTRAPSWKGLIFSLYNRFCLPGILAAADRLIGASFDFIAVSQARASFERERGKWVELPFGVDTNRFFPDSKSALLLQRHELEASLPIILFVGGMDAAHFFKGVPVLLRALALLRDSTVPFQAVLVGEGELRAQFMQQSRVLGLEHIVRFVGRVSDAELPQYYQLADMVVLPSTTAGEAFGMVLLEAMASGVPVIASDLPGVRTIAKRGGITVPPHDAEALAGAMGELLSGSGLGPQMRQDIRRVAEQEFSWPAIAERLEKVYDILLTI